MTGYQAVHLHIAGQGQHFAALLVDDGDRVLGERARDLFERQAVGGLSMSHSG
jgi:hypothetical protein